MNQMYSKIQSHLEKEEPYIHEKIFGRLKNEVECYGRRRLLENIRKEGGKRGRWRDEMVNKSVKESGVEGVKQEISQNISLLKQIK